MTTHTLATNGADIVYDVQGPLPTADGRPPLFMIGQPMDASGFRTFALHFSDPTVITYDPRGLGRSTRRDGRVDNSPTVQADDTGRSPVATHGGFSGGESGYPGKPEAFARKLREVLDEGR